LLADGDLGFFLIRHHQVALFRIPKPVTQYREKRTRLSLDFDLAHLLALSPLPLAFLSDLLALVTSARSVPGTYAT